MIIRIKNKDTLIVKEFNLKCSIGKRGITKNKFEGDFYTPSGKFKIGKLYWRPDRVQLPKTKLTSK
jgi:L,D-peptidoglycan transpeptidase YkuD (ErfK/YbiS/YcfS/YnhG family)